MLSAQELGPRMAPFGFLREWAEQAAGSLGLTPHARPIRGGTGIDPFLEHHIPVANLGTGYFAPESEKEFTAVQVMADHVRWVLAIMERARL